MEVTVTYKNNVQHNAEGEMLFHNDGSVALIDETVIGVMLKTHLVQVTQLNEDKSLIQTGIVPKCEVLWEHKRCPSPALENPDDLVWLSFGSEEEDDGEGELDDDTDYDEQEVGEAEFISQ